MAGVFSSRFLFTAKTTSPGRASIRHREHASPRAGLSVGERVVSLFATNALDGSEALQRQIVLRCPHLIDTLNLMGRYAVQNDVVEKGVLRGAVSGMIGDLLFIHNAFWGRPAKFQEKISKFQKIDAEKIDAGKIGSQKWVPKKLESKKLIAEKSSAQISFRENNFVAIFVLQKMKPIREVFGGRNFFPITALACH